MNFRGGRDSNATHQSSADPEAKLAREGPGKEARFCYSANALMEDRNTILADFQVGPADKTRAAARDRHGWCSPAMAPTDRAGRRQRLCIRKRVEQVFGWTKTAGGLRHTSYRGLGQVQIRT